MLQRMLTLPLTASVVCALALVSSAQAPAGTQAQNPLPGTRRSLDELRQQMFHVSAGRRLKPKSWPEGARVAVSLSFDVDNASATLSTGVLDYEALSRGEYGAVDGLPRILRLLDTHAVPASFFIPAVSAALHPAMIKEIQAAGFVFEDYSTIHYSPADALALEVGNPAVSNQTDRLTFRFRKPR